MCILSSGNHLKEIADICIGGSSFLVAVASFMVGWFAYTRDSGRLDVSVVLGDVWSGVPLQPQHKAIFIRVVNTGRRPVMLSSFGGDNPYLRLKNILRYLKLPIQGGTSFIILNSPIINAAFAPNGSPKVLQEGEFVSVTIPYFGNQDFAEQVAKSAIVYVWDSTNKKHKVKHVMMKNFRKALQT